MLFIALTIPNRGIFIMGRILYNDTFHPIHQVHFYHLHYLVHLLCNSNPNKSISALSDCLSTNLFKTIISLKARQIYNVQWAVHIFCLFTQSQCLLEIGLQCLLKKMFKKNIPCFVRPIIRFFCAEQWEVSKMWTTQNITQLLLLQNAVVSILKNISTYLNILVCVNPSDVSIGSS